MEQRGRRTHQTEGKVTEAVAGGSLLPHCLYEEVFGSVGSSGGPFSLSPAGWGTLQAAQVAI